MDPTKPHSRVIRNDSTMRPLPDLNEIKRLLENDPQSVLSFANQLFSSNKVPAEFRVETAIQLSKKLDSPDKPHLWEALSGMVRCCKEAIDSRLFKEAKRSLSAVHIDSDEAGAIRDFLCDFRIFADRVPKNDPGVFSSESECELFVMLNVMAQCSNVNALGKTISRIADFSTHESYLIRESVVEAIGILGTRSDLDDSDVAPYHDEIQSMMKRLSNDPHPFVRQAALTVESLIDVEVAAKKDATEAND